jgi:hypothetical protein
MPQRYFKEMPNRMFTVMLEVEIVFRRTFYFFSILFAV